MKSASAALITGTALALSTACSACDLPTGPAIAVPPVSAAPTAVVKAYLDAVIARDTKVVRTLTTPKFWELQVSAPDSSLNNWISIKNVHISAPTPDSYELETYRQVNRVFVNFTLRQCEEMTRQDGWNAWSYLLARNENTERWRIVSAGMG